MKLEESLNGGYLGLYGEVVTVDSYEIRTLDFVPSLVIDAGANVGVFTRFARELWPSAKIVAVEPYPPNIQVFDQFTNKENIELLPVAIGYIGRVLRYSNPINGAHQAYMTPSTGYIFDESKLGEYGVESSTVEVTTIADVIGRYWEYGMKTVVKIDIEGAEVTTFTHEPSMELLRQMDYICMEIHQFAVDAEQLKKVKRLVFDALASFKDTHDCTWYNSHFLARKRK